MTANKTRSIGSLIAHIVFVCVFAVANEASAITIRVPQNYATIQAAIDAATDGDEIVVSPGVYVENINFRGRAIVLRSISPTDSAAVALTIIDGNKKGCVVRFAGTETSTCLLSGFTIRNGSGGIDGGGAKGRIEHSVITNNSTSGDGGGGLRSCNGTIQNNVITSNSAGGGAGGGLYGCSGMIQNNVITSNSARFGGGLSVCWGTIQNNVITNNSTGGGLEYDAFGGGLFDCGGTIQHNMITKNSAGGYGGGLYQCNGTIENNVISNNSTRGVGGGGGGLGGCHGTIQNNMITSNSASGYGGGYGAGYGGGLFGCDGMIQNNVISNNSASDYPGCGGGLGLCHGTIRNNTIYGNSAQHVGGAIYHCPAVIVNCIIWGNTGPQDSQISNSSIPSYSCIQGYTAGQGQGNIGSDPRFRSLTDFRLQPGSPCIDAGTNQACPSSDKDGNARPIDGDGDGEVVCDMGAYEYVLAFPPSRYALRLSSNPPIGGTIAALPLPGGDGKYASGTAVSLTANPSNRYSFTGWSGDASGSDNPTQITMGSDKSVTAEFSLLPAIARSPTTLTPSCTVGRNAHSQTFEVWNSGGGTLNYTLLGSALWISSITPPSGASTGERNTHTLRFDTSGLSVGTYEADIAINGPGASNTPRFVHVTLTVYVPPNLTLSNCDFAPSAPVQLQPGASLSVGAFIDNDANGPAAPFWLEVWGSRTGGLTLDYPNLVVNSEPIAGLAARGSRSITTTTALNPIPDGPYTLVFVVDRLNQVPETNEGDNRLVVRGKRLLVTRPQTNVDLVVENFSLGPNPAHSGQPIQLGGQVRNAGNENSGIFWIEFWGSRPDLYPDLHFMLCDSIKIDNLAPSAAVQLSAYSRTLYPGATGTFWVGCFADRPDSINELDETNNYQFIAGHVFNGGTATLPSGALSGMGSETPPKQALPDLIITHFDFSPQAPTQSKPGDSMTISITIANQGSADAGPFWMEWWGSNLGGLNICPQLIDQSERVSGVRAGESRTMTLSKPLMGVPDGPYTVVAVLDRLQEVAESNEGNNRYAAAGKRVLVARPSSGANLVLEDFMGLPSLDLLGPGRGFLPVAKVRNAGTENSGTFWIEFWGSRDQSYPQLDFILCDSIKIENLAPGEMLDLAKYWCIMYGDVPPGNYAIVCFVDRVDQVNETDESDNYQFLRDQSISP